MYAVVTPSYLKEMGELIHLTSSFNFPVWTGSDSLITRLQNCCFFTSHFELCWLRGLIFQGRNAFSRGHTSGSIELEVETATCYSVFGGVYSTEPTDRNGGILY